MAAVAPAEAFHMFDLTGAGVVLIDNLPKALGYAGVTVDLDVCYASPPITPQKNCFPEPSLFRCAGGAVFLDPTRRFYR